ncbi:peptidoglycan-binding domain-containing protein [Streptomyces sp. CWNU-52B]|uniref:peptidoglycan-binding domain-containing protein n=1 Tax=unclassified Streptomyces TaxID=2593676 RepID=UPI0039C2CFEE
MRALTKALVSATAAIGIAAGGLATAGTAMAAPAPTQHQTATGEIGTLAVVNLGLNTTRAKNWQCWLEDSGYDPGAIDGQLGSSSWTAAQKLFNSRGLGAGTPDGIVGPNTISALQKYLNSWGYDLDVDGVAGPATQAAFWDFNSFGC